MLGSTETLRGDCQLPMEAAYAAHYDSEQTTWSSLDYSVLEDK
jgi:hypothetical protein